MFDWIMNICVILFLPSHFVLLLFIQIDSTKGTWETFMLLRESSENTFPWPMDFPGL